MPVRYRVFSLCFDVITITAAIGLLRLIEPSWWSMGILWAYGALQWAEGYLRRCVEEGQR